MTEAATTPKKSDIPENHFTLSDLCEELDIKPQGARVKLRRKLADAKGDGFRWTFHNDRKDEIVELLTAKTERKSKEEADDEGDDE